MWKGNKTKTNAETEKTGKLSLQRNSLTYPYRSLSEDQKPQYTKRYRSLEFYSVVTGYRRNR